MNKFLIIGNLTKDPEIGETPNGTAYARLSIAVNRPFTDENGERKTDYFNVTTWRQQAENCFKYLNKGNKVSVTARLQNRTFEDKNGTKHYVNDIIAEEVEFLSSPSNSATDEEKPAKAANKPSKPQLEEVQEDLPF